MRIAYITLEGEFTSLNPYIDAERTHRMKAAEIKKAETYRVQIETIGVMPVSLTYPLSIAFTWHCENEKTDPDNIFFSKKFILDGLVKAGVIQGDGWKHIRKTSDVCFVDKDRPRVVLEITEFL